MLTIDSLSHRLSSYLEPTQINRVKRAYYYAEQAHTGQYRRSGEPYITHPLAVANILASVHMDHQSLMAAMLHDVIEDTGIGKQAIADQFGSTVADIVDGVSKLAKIEYETQAEKQAKNFQKMALAMAQDLRVIVVKLSDRLHNMRTLGALPPEKKRRIAKETLEIYAPIAHRLGMNDWRIEFEDRGFAAMHPLRASRLQASLSEVRGNRKALVEKIQSGIETRLQRENIDGLVIGREKHLYSIYNKMRSKHKSFKEIMDVYAFRIIVEDIDTCYRALGAIHNLYKPKPGEFKDYIAIPKENGYQSLHTIVIGVRGVPIEVQIRTKEMDELSSRGVAAHWLYKSNDVNSVHSGSYDRANRWIKRLLEIQEHTNSSVEFVENVKIDLFRDEVYVFTPKGAIIELPAGATPVDFAFGVHTQVGNTCVACRINDRPAPLSQVLESGQKVKIITSENSQPNPNWLNFVVTAKARSAIRHYLKNQRHMESVELGKRMLMRALANLDINLEELNEQQQGYLCEQTQVASMEELYESIGFGNKAAYSVAKILQPESDTSSDTLAPITIDSADSLLISFARCCRPIPGDPIIGHMSTGKGIVVHRDSCKNVTDLVSKKENISTINWSAQVAGEFLTEIRVEVKSERGIIATLATRIAQTGTSIEGIQVEERDAESSVITLVIAVNNRIHLANVMRSIRTMRSVARVSRGKN
ncbi:RelA/SpoT family protein [Saccharophagus degradans]|uniref:guanosine-3',5'-bis(diphosphate) 3'-diphosphatase n=2 Tax=Saccharophagus degradans TaxID=86304 RepID=Q21EC7_SACD2|nr:bifunctional (p)ppGpp synthetase/guanosine-3',5'-bis(diphosphate) 3'-pyrophosphohydrolase [Saccharophagus degradans]ABD82952.1 RelA/SpoT family protein [Saccharophagus degradans 2-40]MBU2984988.1 bifunctional (p)ppGpp synthetase/guanosine-3',5'-bis(diphosphate) 3'-pyrophosphohydrolase [Saccharophagus degradans]MDO6423911.1 bifunctional (p)ppGpp synthetase/guanosine-3',5'-bis(diphosphate) 3'-pyrophosphohydrolase [Saccharophagus degradans]MDO6607988.1 bifunctional (p)ppGpp synthetase/guanosine